MEDGLRGPHQRAQTAARAQPQSVSGRGRHGTVGRTRGGRRHAHQYGKSFSKPEERIKRTASWENRASLGEPKKPGAAPMRPPAGPELRGASLGPPEMLFLRQKVASFCLSGCFRKCHMLRQIRT